MRFVKPLDENMIRNLAGTTQLFVTVEEHAVMAGAGSAVNEFMAQAKIVKPISNLGLPDLFLHQATHQQMLQDCGLDAQGIFKSIENFWLD
jgi:1-deoxy-D-xylulose-5-phosphate synthase